MFVFFIGKKDDILFHFVLKYSFKFVVSDDLKIDFFQKWNFLKFRIKKVCQNYLLQCQKFLNLHFLSFITWVG